MSDKLRPTAEAMAQRHEELSIRQRTSSSAFIRFPEFVPASLNLLRLICDLSAELGRELEPLQRGNLFAPARIPAADFSALASLLKILRELLVLLEVRTRR